MASLHIEFTLLENGLDFIWSAVEHLGTDLSKRSLKYAVLNLAAGIELILKERLRREKLEASLRRSGKGRRACGPNGAKAKHPEIDPSSAEELNALAKEVIDQTPNTIASTKKLLS